jgi:hypothetical protein
MNEGYPFWFMLRYFLLWRPAMGADSWNGGEHPSRRAPRHDSRSEIEGGRGGRIENAEYGGERRPRSRPPSDDNNGSNYPPSRPRREGNYPPSRPQQNENYPPSRPRRDENYPASRPRRDENPPPSRPRREAGGEDLRSYTPSRPRQEPEDSYPPQPPRPRREPEDSYPPQPPRSRREPEDSYSPPRRYDDGPRNYPREDDFNDDRSPRRNRSDWNEDEGFGHRVKEFTERFTGRVRAMRPHRSDPNDSEVWGPGSNPVQSKREAKLAATEIKKAKNQQRMVVLMIVILAFVGGAGLGYVNNRPKSASSSITTPSSSPTTTSTGTPAPTAAPKT